MDSMQRLTVTEKTEKRPVSIRSRGVERDCRSIVNQLVSSMPQDILLRTSFTEHRTMTQAQATEEVRVKSRSSFTRKVLFTDARDEYEPSSDYSCGDETMYGESDTFEPVQDDLSVKRLLRQPGVECCPGSRIQNDLGTEFCPGSRGTLLEYDGGESFGSSDDLRLQSWDNTSETTSNSDVSEIAIHSLLVDWEQRGLDREMHRDPDRDRYTSDEEGTVVDNAGDELELIAVSKRPTKLLPHGTVVRTNLEPSVQEARPLNKIWCVKLMDDDHAPEIMSAQLNMVKAYLKARYRLSDPLRAQRNDRITSNLKRWIENGSPDKGYLEEDRLKILKQIYPKRKDVLYLNKDGIVACKSKKGGQGPLQIRFDSVTTVVPDRIALLFT